MLNSCWFHAASIFTLNFEKLCTVIEIRMVLNSCWIHAEFMLNSSQFIKSKRFSTIWTIFGEFTLSTTTTTSTSSTKYKKWVGRLKNNCNGKCKCVSWRCLNSAWIQHHSDLNYCTKLFKIQGENEISMKPAWIQHKLSTNSTPFIVKESTDYLTYLCWIHADFTLISFSPWILKSFVQ